MSNPFEAPGQPHAEFPSGPSEPPTLTEALFGFEGRIGRSTFWSITLGWLVVYGSIRIVTSPLPELNTIAMVIVLVPYAWSSIAITVKRLHDLDRPGTHWFLGLIPLVGFVIVTLPCSLIRGTVGPNRFGPDPIAPAGPDQSDAA